jgi:hypothetical protein
MGTIGGESGEEVEMQEKFWQVGRAARAWAWQSLMVLSNFGQALVLAGARDLQG